MCFLETSRRSLQCNCIIKSSVGISVIDSNVRASPPHTPKLSAMRPYGGHFGGWPRLLLAIFSCAYTAICRRRYANRNLAKDTRVKILFELCSIMVQKLRWSFVKTCSIICAMMVQKCCRILRTNKPHEGKKSRCHCHIYHFTFALFTSSFCFMQATRQFNVLQNLARKHRGRSRATLQMLPLLK